MRHPTIADWADFTRAIADAGNRAALQGHLDGGCGPCRAVVAALERMVTTAEIDGAVTPPAGVVRSVKAFFDLQHPEAVSRWRDLSLRRAFDSALMPLAASRSTGTATRQLLFESDHYTLELNVDYRPGEADAVLRGQILEAHGEPRSHTPVFLVGSGEVVARAMSERHGTFELSSPLDERFELWAFPDDGNRIRLRLELDNQTRPASVRRRSEARGYTRRLLRAPY